jgi:hypothetical protein
MQGLEYRYHNLKSEVASLETKQQNLVKIVHDYNRQATALGKTFDSYCLRCEQAMVTDGNRIISK